MYKKSKNPENVGLGVDLGGTKIAGALFNARGMVSPKTVLYLENKIGEQVGEQIFKLVQSFLEWSAKNGMQIRTIGMAVPGIYHSETGRVWAPNIPGWDDFPLLEKLSNKLADMDISIDNDRACYILGETWKGAAMGCKHAIFLAVGTGIGAGILIDGRVLRGADDIAGATGWMALTDPFLPAYKRHGCFEYHASGPGITRTAMDIQARDKGSTETAGQLAPAQMTTGDIFKAYEEGNPLAEKVIFQAIRFWGKASANLVSLFNPQKIIFGGGVFGPATQFIREIYLEAKKWAQPVSIGRVIFEPSKLGSDAGLYGAGYLSMKSKKNDDKI
jgi:glucokinase